MFGRKREKVQQEDRMDAAMQSRLLKQRTRNRANAIKVLLTELMMRKASEGRYTGMDADAIKADAARTLRLAANIHDAVACVVDPDGVLI